MPEIDRSEPPYLQISRHLRDQITSGALVDGDIVPSARQLAADWHVANATATKALNVLRTEGLVRGVQGVGTIVQAQPLHHSPRDYTVSVHRTGRIYPPGHYARILASELVPAPDTAAAALGVDTGTPVIRRRRTTYNASDAALSTSISWFPGDLAGSCPLLLTTERIAQGTTRYVEDQTGRTRSPRERILMSAGAATDDEATELGVAVGSPVLRTRNFYWDANGGVIEYGEAAASQGLETAIDYTVEEITT